MQLCYDNTKQCGPGVQNRVPEHDINLSVKRGPAEMYKGNDELPSGLVNTVDPELRAAMGRELTVSARTEASQESSVPAGVIIARRHGCHHGRCACQQVPPRACPAKRYYGGCVLCG